MTRPRGTFVLPILAGLLASFATAVIAHGLISLTGNLEHGGNSYAEHEHAAVAPVALGAIMLFVTGLLRSSLRSLSHSERVDPITVLAGRFAEMQPLLPCVCVALGGAVTLLCMEFSEQLTAFGHIQGIDDAFGGNCTVGVAIIVAVAALLTVVGLRSAQSILSSAFSVATAIVAWIVADAPSKVDRAAIARGPQHRRHASQSAFLARSLGLRAPPLRLV